MTEPRTAAGRALRDEYPGVWYWESADWEGPLGIAIEAEAAANAAARVDGLREALDLLERSQREQNVHLFRRGMDLFREALAALPAPVPPALDPWEATKGVFADMGWPPTSEQASLFFAALERRGYQVARLSPPAAPEPPETEQPVHIRIRSANCAAGDHDDCLLMVEQDEGDVGITDCLCLCHGWPTETER